MDVKRQIAYELHRDARRHYPRRHVTVKKFKDLFQADLCDMRLHENENRGYCHILTIIDCFSKYSWAVALKTKRGKEVADAFRSVLESREKKFLKPPKFLQVDRGSEFYSSAFKNMLADFNITLYSTYSNLKASQCERLNKSLKHLIYREFSASGSYVWVDKLDDLMRKYNHRVHRTIQMAPAKVTLKDEKRLQHIHNFLHKSKKRGRVKFRLNDAVRISKIKGVFEKSYTPSWSTEVFRIKEVCNTSPVTYKLEDLKGTPIQGGFYNEEICKTNYPDIYLVEKVLKKKARRAFVKFLGLPDSENQWIPIKDIL
jgi:hypothetical protein